LKGEAFPNAPQWQLVSDGEYDFPITGKLGLFFGASETYRSDTNSAFGNRVETKIPAYGLLDVRAGIQSADGVWRAQLWGRNVLDRFFVLNVSHVTDAVARTVGMPATFGITVSAHFN
jgi:outer membrane receptor protein involved in Fe transport